TGPDLRAVADDVLVVHEVGDAGNAPRREPAGLQHPDVGVGRGRDGDRLLVVDVVDEAPLDAALERAVERVDDRRLCRAVHAEVVQGDVQRVLRTVEVLRDPPGDRLGLLAAVGEGSNFQQAHCASPLAGSTCGSSRGSWSARRWPSTSRMNGTTLAG